MEHAELAEAYRDAGVEVELITPDPELPYMVYARDFGACLAEGALIGSLGVRAAGRGTPLWGEARELGVPMIGKVARGSFEGGDFWLLDDATIVHGIVARTDWEGLRNAAGDSGTLGLHAHRCSAPSKDLHLDMAFNIVAPGVAVCATEQMPEFFLRMLRKRGFELIEVASAGVLKHHCNIEALGGDRVVTFAANKAVNEKLRALGLYRDRARDHRDPQGRWRPALHDLPAPARRLSRERDAAVAPSRPSSLAVCSS